MKRPFLYGAISMLIALLTWFLGYWFMPMTIVLVLMMFKDAQLHPKKKYFNLIFVLVGLLSVAYFIYVDMTYEAVKETIEAQEFASGRGVIKSVDYTDYSTIYGLSPWWDNEGVKQNFSIRVSSRSGGAIGDYVAFEGQVKSDLKGHNEGAFDLGHYYKESGVVALVKGDIYIDYHSHDYWYLAFFNDLRQNHSKRLHLLLDDRYAAIVDDLLLGLKEVSDEDRELFQTSGTVHILAISGLHVALIASLLFKCMGLIYYNQRVNAVLVSGLIIVYCLYTGAHTSTVRASVMIITYFGHMIIYRKYDQHTGLALAFVAMICYNPLQITSPGFMLSFGAVLSIFFIVPRLIDVLAKRCILLKPLVFMAGIQLGLGPLLGYYYGVLPTYSFLGNLLLLPVVTFVISFSGLAIGLSYLSGQLAIFISGSAFWLINYMLFMVETISQLPASLIPIPEINPWIYAIYYWGLIAWLMGRKRIMYIMGLCLIISFIAMMVRSEDTLTIDMMDVGNGDACFLRYDKHVILIDGGGQVGIDGPNVGEKVLLPYLNKHGIGRINTVVISHSDYDHIYGIIELMNLVTIDRVLLSSVYEDYNDKWVDRMKELAREQGIELVYIDRGDSLKLGDLTLECLYPFDATKKDDNNNHSNILHLFIDDFDMIFTGDAYEEVELELLAQWPATIGDVEVLKVPHHGSKTSSSKAFIEWLHPDISLVSVSRNNIYGHPADEVTRRLNTYSDRVYMTKDHGQITITYNDGKIKIDTYIK